MHIAENPEIADLATFECEESGTQPLDWLPGWLIAEEFAAMNPRKAHTGKCFRLLGDKIKNVAPIFSKSLMNEVYV